MMTPPPRIDHRQEPSNGPIRGSGSTVLMTSGRSSRTRSMLLQVACLHLLAVLSLPIAIGGENTCAAVPSPSVQAFLEACPTHVKPGGWYSIPEDPDPRDVVSDLVRTLCLRGQTAEDVEGLVRGLRRDFDLPGTAALPLTRAVLGLEAGGRLYWRSHPRPPPGFMENIASDLLMAIDRAPGFDTPALALGFVFDALAQYPTGLEDRIAALIEASSEPGLLALRLRKGSFPLSWRLRFLALALERQPRHPALLAAMAEEIARVAPGWEYRAALYQSASIAAERGRFRTTLAQRACLAQEHVRSLLSLGLCEEAMRIFRSLPSLVRAEILSGKTEDGVTTLGGLPFTVHQEDLRADIAMMMISCGDPERGRVLVHGLPAGVPRDLLNLVLTDSDRDPFDMFLNEASKRGEEELGWMGQVYRSPRKGMPPIGWNLPLARLLEERGSRPGAAFLYRSAGLWIESMLRRSAPIDPRLLPSRIRKRAGSLRSRSLTLASQMGYEVRRLPSDDLFADRPDRDRMAGAVSRLISEPNLHPFVEDSLPDTVEPVPSDYEKTDSTLPEELRSVTFPDDFHPERMERTGDDIVAIARDWVHDEESGYWVRVSLDAAQSWGPPLFTGLSVMAPWELQASSKLPLLRSGILDLEAWRLLEDCGPDAELRELSRGQVIFICATERAIRLRTPLERLRMDSDADSLTDLLEERLFMDPRSPDTDEDGTSDAEDLLPLIPADMADGAPLGPVATAMGWVLGGEHEERVRKSYGARADQILRRLREWEGKPSVPPTTVVVGDRELYRNFSPARRTVILSETEADEAVRKFRKLDAFRIERIIPDRKGERILIWWSGPSVWGTYLLRKKGDGWDVEVLSSYVS